jgi:general transcription factor 3C polypeptide 5 (transcription factor C subunit 1)
MGEHSAELLLHPDDRMSKPILSGNTRTSDVLLQIVVPKRTGRKRKKDSDGQFHSWESSRGLQTPPETNPRDIRRVLRILKDTHGKHLIHPLGILEHTHRFRSKG